MQTTSPANNIRILLRTKLCETWYYEGALSTARCQYADQLQFHMWVSFAKLNLMHRCKLWFYLLQIYDQNKICSSYALMLAAFEQNYWSPSFFFVIHVSSGITTTSIRYWMPSANWTRSAESRALDVSSNKSRSRHDPAPRTISSVASIFHFR